MSAASQVETLLNTVIENGYCIGCGVCAAVDHSPFKITATDHGQYAANFQRREPDCDSAVMSVCPFAENARNETELGRELFPDAATEDSAIGRYIGTYAGFVAEDDFRATSSSGGLIKWILCELLKEGYVDKVVHVVPGSVSDCGVLFKYAIAENVTEVRRGASSAYYPVEMSEVLAYVKTHPGRYVFTGVPCFIKALRLLMRQDPVYQKRIVYCIALICGHLKSRHYADLLGWQFGIAPGNLGTINFRAKLPGTRANQKGVVVSGLDDEGRAVQGAEIVQNLFGTDYAQGFFKYQACDYCDDIVGETADLSVGDAWLPEYVQDGRGTNIVVVRNEIINTLISAGIAAGRLSYAEVGADKVVLSQAGGVRHKREGLSYRLWLNGKAGSWHPSKRVPAERMHIPVKRRKIYQQRVKIAQSSHIEFASAVKLKNLEQFVSTMSPLIKKYKRLNQWSLFQRLYFKIQRLGVGK